MGTRFEAILEAANGVTTGPNAISSLVAIARLVGREYAYYNLLHQLGSGEVQIESLRQWEDLKWRYGIPQGDSGGERVWLAWDAVIAVPWSMDRIIRTLTELSRGPVGEAEAWSFDPGNHQVVLWLPMRLAQVWKGNHSITAGILCNAGSVPATAIFDLAPLFEILELKGTWERGDSSGVAWRDRGSDQISQVFDWRLGALFEIGRLLHNLSFDGRLGGWRP
jgi:hypothetical protein